MKIRSLQIARLPGIRDPFTIKDLAPGLNLIIGPNASGKTSLCRAFRSLLWPEEKRMEHASLAAELLVGDREFSVQREGDATSWILDAENADSPPLPEGHLAKCFTVEIDDLGAAESGDADLAQEVLRHMAGGYDLPGLLTGEGYRVKKSHGRAEQAAVEEGRRNLARIRTEHLELSTSESRLSSLEEGKRAAGSAREELRNLELTLDLVRARRERLSTEESLASFAAHMQKLEGKEMDRILELRQENQEKTESIAERGAVIERAHEIIETADLPEDGLDSLALAKHLAGIEELRGCEADLRNQEQLLEDAEMQVRRARENLGNRDLSTTCIDDSVLRRAEAYLKQVDVLNQQRANLETRIRHLANDREPADIAELQQAAACLREWLAAPQVARRYRRWVRVLSAALCLTGLAAALLAAIQIHPAFWILAGSCLLLAVWIMVLEDHESIQVGQQAAKRFQLTGLTLPREWTSPAVEASLRALDKEIAAAALEVEKSAEARALASQLEELEELESELSSERGRLLRDTGLDLSVSSLGLVLLTRNLADLQDAVLERDQLLRRSKALQAEQVRLSSLLLNYLASFAEHCEGNATAIHLHSERLRERAAEWLASRQQLRDASAEKKRLQSELDSLAEKEAWIFRSLELKPGDDQTLIASLDKLQSYREVLTASRQAVLAEKICREKLSDPQLEASEEELLAAIDERRELAERFEPLVEEIAEIRQRIDAARRGSALSRAMKVQNDAMDSLADRLEEASLATAGRSLLAGVEEQHAREARPEILERAAELFAEFTSHEYELRLSDGWGGQQARFVALDTGSDRLRSLGELSTGTRSQLLIAVRLAFAMHAERGEALPFFLDDVLSTTDPSRFEKVVKSLQSFAEKDGRQIIYLTSNPADIAAWRRDGEINVIDLAEVRALGRSVRDESDLVAPELPEVLLPRSLSPSEYAAAIKVPPFRPLREASEVHLFYLLRHDLKLLHRILSGRVEYLGPLRSMISGGRLPGELSPEDRKQVEALIELTLGFNQAWRIGRGLAVDRLVLREAGVSERFLNDFAAIAAEAGGSADRLLQVIDERQDPRVKGFRKDKLESLREALTASGHLDRRPKLSEDEIRAELLRALEPAIRNGSISDSAIIQRVHELVHHAQNN